MTDWTAVASSRINALAHEDGALKVIFNDGSVWSYAGVTEQQHRELMDAPSIGKAFEHFRKNHQGTKDY